LDLTGVDAALQAQQVLALDVVRTALDSSRYVALLQLLHEVAAAPGLSAAAAAPCRDGLEGLVDREWRRLRRQTRRLGTTQPPATWHEARIRAKRTRYAAEAVGVALGPTRRAKRARVVQELLGEHQDAEVAVDRLRELADARPDLAFVCGALSEREAENARAARTTFLARRTKLRLG
jgi:CHAD domain-containing protein